MVNITPTTIISHFVKLNLGNAVAGERIPYKRVQKVKITYKPFKAQIYLNATRHRIIVGKHHLLFSR